MNKPVRILVGLLAMVVLAAMVLRAQQAPVEPLPASIAGSWTLYCNDPRGGTSAKYLTIEQTGTALHGHFKGPNQSGGFDGTINGQHVVIRTKTRGVLVFRGRIDGPRVNGVIQGDTFTGTFHDRGGTGTFQGQRSK